ncbi:hypothetical protein [Tissierella creatinophila]|uniref:Uncharacterized protein n=1 Tax=Tissierella creatinophila DSM 6911 TaxID=1123403 RepID=A0A1U7M3K0_TISCR|nr:hypothetical protein [Tissierella creatinophila]OLS01855.1 hypothetical protein TICRE_22320 [Tissierella creatinophila DSM 6911]
MKKMILGISMFVTGFIGFAILCGATMASNYTLNGSTYYMEMWRLFGITPIVIGFLILGVVGIIITIIGLFQKSE